MPHDSVRKIATASRSREISQINDYDGVFKKELRSSRFTAGIVWPGLVRTGRASSCQLPGKLIRLRRFQQLTSVAFGATAGP